MVRALINEPSVIPGHRAAMNPEPRGQAAPLFERGGAALRAACAAEPHAPTCKHSIKF